MYVSRPGRNITTVFPEDCKNKQTNKTGECAENKELRCARQLLRFWVGLSEVRARVFSDL